jgi:Mg-chelatase subunit ChlD
MLIFLAYHLFSQDLAIGPGDLRLEQQAGEGVHLYIRKKAGIASVLLTESTQDPSRQADNYAYRARDWNAVNGDEIRIINGVPIPRENRFYSIIDSTPENHLQLGSAFHLFLPYTMIYGSANTRHGEVRISDGVYINIRSFALPYGDYRGGFRDNPYRLQVTQTARTAPPLEVPEGYLRDTVEAFSNISASGQGELIYSTGPEDLVEKIKNILERERGKTVDMVLCLDTTSSMKNDIDAVRDQLIPMLAEIISNFTSFRIGLVLYKDYFDSYLNQVIPFTSDFMEFQVKLNNIQVNGGRDIPEAVYEALYAAAIEFPWQASSRLVVLIGDAPPHARPRGEITQEMVDAEVKSRGLKVNAIILPQ